MAYLRVEKPRFLYLEGSTGAGATTNVATVAPPDASAAAPLRRAPAPLRCAPPVEDHVWFEDRWMVASLCDE
jgi:hypothetical protein